MSSGSLLVDADEDLGSDKEENEDKSTANSLSSGSFLVSFLVSVDEVIVTGKVGNDDKSIEDSLSSASLLVSVNGDVAGPKEYNENKSIADSISSVSLLVSLDGDGNGRQFAFQPSFRGEQKQIYQGRTKRYIYS